MMMVNTLYYLSRYIGRPEKQTENVSFWRRHAA